MGETLLKLPEKPGTVIAIGGRWLVRLPGYEGAPSAWELLPFATEAIRNRAESIGVKAQCVYGDEWVLAEAEQEGGYLVIADPREEPSGIQYFKPVPARLAAAERKRPYGWGDRVVLEHDDGRVWHGEVRAWEDEESVQVRWDHDPEPLDVVHVPALKPEASR
jgi:hypothetical protein